MWTLWTGSTGCRWWVFEENHNYVTPQEIKETGQRLFEAKQYADAIPLLEAASEAFPEDESVWRELVIATHHSGQIEQACKYAKDAIHRHPKSGWLWRQLGCELTHINHLDEAEKALKNARSLLGYCDEWLWRYMARLYRTKNDIEKEIYALENLCEIDEATGDDFNQLGIAYYNHRDFAKAVECYRRSYEIETSVAPLFNMGLVFNDPELSRDLDAADAYRRVLAIQPAYNKAQKMLEKTKIKLLPLADHAKASATWLVKFNDRFQFYANPFELLQIKSECSLDELSIKELQRAKKLLLHEIDVNDSKVSWLEDYPLDKAKAIAIIDELDDETQRLYHWKIFYYRPLLDFLTRGEIHHFLYSDTFFPLDMLDFIDEEPGFLDFLSKPFAQQYNHVLTEALKRQLFPVVEVLFDGRRWVNPEDEDICLKGAFNRIGSLVELIKSKFAEYGTEKPSLDEFEDFLHTHSFVELFNLLPTAFASFQREVVAEIRSLAIDCYNEHDDAELSMRLLSICKRFTSRSVELTKQLEKDYEAIEKIISEQRRIKRAVLEQQSRKPTPRHNAERQHVPNWVFVNDPYTIPNRTDKRKIPTQTVKSASYPKVILRWIAVIAVVCCIIWAINSSDSTNKGHNDNSSIPPFTYRPPTKTTSSSGSKNTYRVPSYISAELENDNKKIESEKRKVRLLEIQIENLEREIEKNKLYLNRESQVAIDEYNQKVHAYNKLVEEAKAQTNSVNYLVDRYNQKLRQYGR